jgi:hypothetical protein
MASNPQRTQAICDALLNSISTQAQQLELAEALHARFVEPFDSLTNAEKAAIIPRELYEICMGKVKELRRAKRGDVADPRTDYPEGT